MPAYIPSTVLEVYYRREHKYGIEVIIEDKVEKRMFHSLQRLGNMRDQGASLEELTS